MKPKIIKVLPMIHFNRLEKALLEEIKTEIASGYEYQPYELEEKINEFLQNHQYCYPRCNRKKITIHLSTIEVIDILLNYESSVSRALPLPINKNDSFNILRVGKEAENGDKIFILITIIFLN